MPNWKEVLAEIHEENKNGNKTALDSVRRKYLAKISEKTGRNVIAYYSGWLQGRNPADVIVNDKDKNAFMVNIHKLDRTVGLDLNSSCFYAHFFQLKSFKNSRKSPGNRIY